MKVSFLKAGEGFALAVIDVIPTLGELRCRARRCDPLILVRTPD
jgi:hypothetical protein